MHKNQVKKYSIPYPNIGVTGVVDRTKLFGLINVHGAEFLSHRSCLFEFSDFAKTGSSNQFMLKRASWAAASCELADSCHDEQPCGVLACQ